MGWTNIQTITKTAAATTIQLDPVDKLGKYAFAITPTMPSKGELITMDLGNATPAYGINNTYRVLTINDTVAEVMAMYSMISTAFNGSGNSYSGSVLDTYLNNTFYNSLSPAAQNAIKAKEIKCYQYEWSGTIESETHRVYYDYTVKTLKENVGSRYVYAIEVEDIEKYFGGTDTTAGVFGSSELLTFIFNKTTEYSLDDKPWTRSLSSISGYPYAVCPGYSSTMAIWAQKISATKTARPVFCIDLSEITWERVS